MMVTIHNVGFSADGKLKEFINTKISKLSRYYNRIIGSDIYLKLENSGQIKDKVVEITLDVPQKKLICKSEGKKFEAAIDNCISSLERQLKKYKEKQSA